MRSNRSILVAAFSLAIAACSTTGDVEVVERSIDDDDVRGSSSPRAYPPSAVTSRTESKTYSVSRGDTLFGIAFRHGVDVSDLVRWNGISNPDTIYPGQVLKVGETRVVASRPSSREEQSARVRARDVAATARTTTSTTRRVAARGSAYPPRVRSDRGARHDAEQGAVAIAPPSSRTSPPPKPLREGEVETRPLEDGMVETRPLSSEPAPPAPRSNPVTEEARAPTVIASAPTPAAVAAPPVPATAAPATAIPARPKPIEPAASRTASGVSWRWPVRGTVMQRYAAGDPARQGIDIRGNPGDAVTAAADGEVVYSGNGLLGYGELVIVKHSGTFLSAYAHNRARLVKEGDRVKAGQQIAEMGSTGAGVNALHFEIRQNGKPVDPLQFLPK